MVDNWYRPELVWTNKNISYCQSVIILNSQQSCWSLFLFYLNLSISYCLGSKNLKPDALSRFYSYNNSSFHQVAPLPQSHATVMSNVGIGNHIGQALSTGPDTGTSPPNKYHPQSEPVSSIGSTLSCCGFL